jgi:hypothetical protein
VHDTARGVLQPPNWRPVQAAAAESPDLGLPKGFKYVACSTTLPVRKSEQGTVFREQGIHRSPSGKFVAAEKRRVWRCVSYGLNLANADGRRLDASEGSRSLNAMDGLAGSGRLRWVAAPLAERPNPLWHREVLRVAATLWLS